MRNRKPCHAMPYPKALNPSATRIELACLQEKRLTSQIWRQKVGLLQQSNGLIYACVWSRQKPLSAFRQVR